MARTLVTLALALSASAPVQADGCKIRIDGRFVPEHEQQAFIAWADGVETLHVAALSEPTRASSVWVVPIRATATAVRAEPVDEMPTVVYYTTLKARARSDLAEWWRITLALNSGCLFCPLGGVGCGDSRGPDAKETSRVERLGMVVTVVSAQSRNGLEGYLARQGVNVRAVNLKSLEPYFGQAGFAFVCGWVANPDRPVSATGIRVEFPSPNLWFPLMPTRAYSDPVRTVVYAKGFVKPADGCDLPDLKCEYIYGAIAERGIGQAFSLDRRTVHSRREPMTRVTLTTDPSRWDRDLELVPGTTANGSINQWITGWAARWWWVFSALIGGLLGLALPHVLLGGRPREVRDYAFGVAVGAGLLLTVWTSVGLFAIWRAVRTPRDLRWRAGLATIALLAAAQFGIIWGICQGLTKAVASE